MTNESIEDEYPHWKDALFGNHNAVANIRCAIHYVFWHVVYGMIAVGGAVVVASIKISASLTKYLGPLGAPVERGLLALLRGVSYVVNHRYTELFIRGVVYLAVGIAVFGFLHGLYTQFWLVLTMIGIILGFLILAILIVAVATYLREPTANTVNSMADSAKSAGERAVETPGVRRVYGECPVSMEQAPKWFDNLFPDDL